MECQFFEAEMETRRSVVNGVTHSLQLVISQPWLDALTHLIARVAAVPDFIFRPVTAPARCVQRVSHLLRRDHVVLLYGLHGAAVCPQPLLVDIVVLCATPKI